MTILFENDWRYFPSAIVDYDTTNATFKRMVSLYQRMGIKNALWPLSLLQPHLSGIDPHDETLSDELKVCIGLECRYNFWYFIREVVRIPPIAGPHPISYKASRGNLALSWSFLNNIDIALIQPRQTGKSVSTDCIMVWLLYIGASNTIISMLTKDHVLRTKNVERLKRIRDFLPPYVTTMTKRDSDNQTELTCRELNNTYITGVGQTSEAAANNLGRGLTSPVQHIDEGPYIRFIGTTIPAALAAGTAAREEAREHGRPYGAIFTTTAGKKDERDGYYMYQLIHGGAVWTESFYDSDCRESLIKLIKHNCSGRKILINATFSHRQLGKTDQWLYEAIATTGATSEEANRDFFNIWTSGSRSSPLSTQLNETIHESEIDPVYNEITKESYIVRWYLDEATLLNRIQEETFVVGLDTSDAIGRDAIALVILSTRDLGVVGAATINETNLLQFSRFLANFLIRYPNLVLIPERKSSAQSIIDALVIYLTRENIDPFKRIYNSVVDQKDEQPKQYQKILAPLNRRTPSFYDPLKRTFGFNTTGSSRDLLYSSVLQNAAKQAGYMVRDRTLSSEIRGLMVKNGRIDHGSDSHDDMVIAWLIAHWMLTHSRHLSFYGIDQQQAFSAVHGQGRVLTEEEHYVFQQQRALKEQINHYYEKLSETNDEYSIAQYEAKLHALSKSLKHDESDAFSIDSLIQQASEQRMERQRQHMLSQQRERQQHRSAHRSRSRYRRPFQR